jgi:hypothetical protein
MLYGLNTAKFIEGLLMMLTVVVLYSLALVGVILAFDKAMRKASRMMSIYCIISCVLFGTPFIYISFKDTSAMVYEHTHSDYCGPINGDWWPFTKMCALFLVPVFVSGTSYWIVSRALKNNKKTPHAT